jgi:hypothetical protein
MREELAIFVRENYSPEKQELLKEGFSVFEDLQLQEYDTPFMELITEFNSRDYLDIVADFELLVQNSLVSLIKEHGIELSTEADLTSIVKIIKSIIDIQFYDDKETILRFLETDYDSVEKLSNILSLTNDYTVENYCLAIEEVNDNIFNLLQQLCITGDSDISEPIVADERSKAVIKTLKKLRDFYDSNDFIAFKIIEKGFGVLLSFDIYKNYLKRALLENTNELLIAKEIYAVLVISEESHISPLNYFRKISYELLDDVTLVTKVDTQITKLINDFEIYKGKNL